MKSYHRELEAVVAAALALGFYPGPVLGSGTEPQRIALPNGIVATIYSSDYLLTRTTFEGTRGQIDLGDGTYLTVITDIADPLIVNKGDGQFHAFPTDGVIEQLREIEYRPVGLRAEVFVLPFPRSNLLVSSTSDRRIFLSPHVYEVTQESAAYIVAHEMGHVFQNRFLPETAQPSWQEYRILRGIDDTRIYHGGAEHANRPVEIFAEDFRVLYGGPSAYFDGRVENPSLPGPSMVPGLYAFFSRLAIDGASQPFVISVNNYPNPFNPRTELVVQLSPEFMDTGEVVSVRVYDVRGALVRELYASHPADPQLRVEWDGRDQAGNVVASSAYFGVVQAGTSTVSQKMLMIK